MSKLIDKLSELDELREKIAGLKASESALAGECIELMKAAKADAVELGEGRRADLVKPSARKVLVKKFKVLVAKLFTADGLAKALSVVKETVSVGDAEKFLGDKIEQVCETSSGTAYIKFVNTRGNS